MTSLEDAPLKETKSTSAPYFRPRPPLREDTERLFTQYSGLARESLDKHIAQYVSQCYATIFSACFITALQFDRLTIYESEVEHGTFGPTHAWACGPS